MRRPTGNVDAIERFYYAVHHCHRIIVMPSVRFTGHTVGLLTAAVGVRLQLVRIPRARVRDATHRRVNALSAIDCSRIPAIEPFQIPDARRTLTRSPVPPLQYLLTGETIGCRCYGTRTHETVGPSRGRFESRIRRPSRLRHRNVPLWTNYEFRVQAPGTLLAGWRRCGPARPPIRAAVLRPSDLDSRSSRNHRPPQLAVSAIPLWKWSSSHRRHRRRHLLLPPDARLQ